MYRRTERKRAFKNKKEALHLELYDVKDKDLTSEYTSN